MVVDGQIRFPAGPVTLKTLESFRIDSRRLFGTRGNRAGFGGNEIVAAVLTRPDGPVSRGAIRRASYCEANVCAAALSDFWSA